MHTKWREVSHTSSQSQVTPDKMIGSAAAVHPLVMVEVTPLIVTSTRVYGTGAHEGGDCIHFLTHRPISNPSAKLQLLNMSRRGLLTAGWLDAGISTKANSETNTKHTRGLRMKVKLPRGLKCKFCQKRVQPAEPRRNIRGDTTHPNHFNSYQTIISGDLLFRWEDEDAAERNKESIRAPSIFVTSLRSDDPLDEQGVPCLLRGYILAPKTNSPSERRCYCQAPDHQCVLTSDTAVYVCPPLDVSYDRDGHINGSIRTNPNDYLLTLLPGTHNLCEASINAHNPQFKSRINTEERVEFSSHYSKLSCYNKETVQSLSLRMSSILANTVWIGTNQYALSKRNKSVQMYDTMTLELSDFWGLTNAGVYKMLSTRGGKSSKMPLLLREGAILVHNSHPNSGKSTLVEAVAIDVLKCSDVHKISAPALIAKYGISADAAFESILHELALRCAVKGGTQHEQPSEQLPKLCIILDHFESFLPFSSQTAGDPYLPVFNGMSKFSLRTRYLPFVLLSHFKQEQLRT